MAPPRYGNQSINGPYHMQQSHLQSHPSAHQHGALPPPTHLGTSSFGAGGSSSASPFAMTGNLNNGFDRTMLDGSLLPGQIPQMGFTRGGPVQGHQTFDGLSNPLDGKDDARIRNVWKHNLREEMDTLRRLVDTYPYIAMDTEFPGIVARPIGQFTTKADYHYQTLRCNVDLLKVIQLGITLFKPDGTLPPPDAESPQRSQFHPTLQPTPCTWQFNFKFSLETDMYARESTQMLIKAGIDFDKHSKHGIEPNAFASLLISSGLVMDADVRWISFHSGYDFGYLIKLMICQPLPADEAQFHTLIEKFFPALFDIKFILKHAGAKGQINSGQPLTQEAAMMVQRTMTKSGLQDIAEELGVARIGQAHQAGSDSLLTGQVYFKMREKIFSGTIEEEKYRSQVWGLNAQMPVTATGAGGQGSSRDFSTPHMNGATFYNQNGTPTTPQTGNIGMSGGQGGGGPSSHTPVPSQNLMGAMTPGGFGNFQYQRQST
ncbi:CCR4-NOT transcription complex subunit 7 [Cladophialophora carrionii]|uniref:poly(A)-specific ribonuclease n=1 Tax=Cladophialophora carrionii TaxID=86049 RepID=A0A1C1D210_9EURO|nr:CCR4-NOT transcription complex subunit 7 [Cladophialophora carrionii]